MKVAHIQDSQTKMMMEHHDGLDAKKNPKQRRFMNSLKEGRNEVLGKHRLKMGTGSAIAVGLRPTERYSKINGKWAWRKV